MNFEQRKAAAVECLVEFLNTLTPPRGLAPDQQATKIGQIADAFARRMPTDGDYREKVRAVLTRVTDTHLSNTWPAPAVFVMAMPDERRDSARAPETFGQAGWKEIISRKMAAGEPVAEGYVFGIRSKWLLDDGEVDPDTMQKYRWGAVKAYRDVHGKDAEAMLERRYGAYVRPFLSVPTEDLQEMEQNPW